MTKFYETHFDEYLKMTEKKDLHPKLSQNIFDKLPESIDKLPNLIVYGPKGVGKYTQVLKLLKRYSPSELKYEKKLAINFNKSQLYYKVSDIHIEVDMSLLGCNAKVLWNDIYNQLIDIAYVKQDNTFIIVCKNFQEIHSELLDNFYSYMQTTYYVSVKLIYILVTDQISFLPENIVNITKQIAISRPNKTAYTKCIGKKIPKEININEITNIKNVHSKITQLMNPHEITCDKILDVIDNYNAMQFSQLRDLCYDIFIYNLDIYECIWYIIKQLTMKHQLPDDKIENVLITGFNFFKYYNNNYRPIYHLENYILYLIKVINGL